MVALEATFPSPTPERIPAGAPPAGLSLHEPERRPFQSRATKAHKDYHWKKAFPDGEWTDLDLPEMREQLSPRQVTAADLLVRGISLKGVCERLGCTMPKLEEWMHAPWWLPLEEERRQVYFGNKHATFMPLMPKALKRLSEELDGLHGADNAHDSMIFVLEQVHGKPTQQKVVESKGDGQSLLADVATILRSAAAANAQLRASDAEPPLLADVREVPADGR